MKRLASPGCSSVSVKWQQFNPMAPAPVQAPKQLHALFNDCHTLVYGFVPHCTQVSTVYTGLSSRAQCDFCRKVMIFKNVHSSRSLCASFIHGDCLTQATLLGNLSGQELSTMVSTSELQKTTGTVSVSQLLHQTHRPHDSYTGYLAVITVIIAEKCV